MNRMRKDISGQAGMVTFFIGAMIAVIIALQVAWPVIDASLYGSGGVATNTFNFTGNSSSGQYVNITTPGISPGVMCYYFNTTGIGKPTGCLVVDVRSGANTSTGSATALRASINGDTDFIPYVTVSNTSTTNVVLTANTAGSTYNWVTSETVTNGSFASTSFVGGEFGGLDNMGTSARTLVEQIPLFLVLVLLMVFIKAVV